MEALNLVCVCVRRGSTKLRHKCTAKSAPGAFLLSGKLSHICLRVLRHVRLRWLANCRNCTKGARFVLQIKRARHARQESFNLWAANDENSAAARSHLPRSQKRELGTRQQIVPTIVAAMMAVAYLWYKRVSFCVLNHNGAILEPYFVNYLRMDEHHYNIY